MADRSDNPFAVALPPLERDGLEDAVCAALQALGYYVEPNPRAYDQLGRDDFGELDATARRFVNKRRADTTVVEVKSGGWHRKDAIALLGHTTFVGADRALLVTAGAAPPAAPVLVQRFAEVGLGTVHLSRTLEGDVAHIFQALAEALGRPTAQLADHGLKRLEALRHAYATRRALPVPRKVSAAALAGAPETEKRLSRLVKRLTGGSALIGDPVARLRELQELYDDCGRGLTMDVARAAGATRPGGGLAWSVLTEGAHPVVQHAMLLELELRLAMTSALVEVACEQRYLDVRTDSPAMDRILSEVTRETRLRVDYPQLWQTFIYGWGGFFIDEGTEIPLLAHDVGMPVDAVRRGLTLWDRAFPPGALGWWRNTEGLRILMHVPAAIRGAGLFHHLTRRGLHKLLPDGRLDLSEVGPPGTVAALRSWNHAAVGVRAPELLPQ